MIGARRLKRITGSGVKRQTGVLGLDAAMVTSGGSRKKRFSRCSKNVDANGGFCVSAKKLSGESDSVATERFCFIQSAVGVFQEGFK